MATNRKFLGYTCSYTPLPLIDAANFFPYRVLPVGDNPDHAPQYLHENLCPHVKKVLDRGLSGDIPEIEGMVFMISCNAMHRLADVWRNTFHDQKTIFIDLPVRNDEEMVSYFAEELIRFKETLEEISGNTLDESRISQSIEKYNNLYSLLSKLKNKFDCGEFPGGAEAMQAIYNTAATDPVDETISFLEQKIEGTQAANDKKDDTIIYLFGNVLPDPLNFSLFASKGIKLVTDITCTGSNMFFPLDLQGNESIYVEMSRCILQSPACARTLAQNNPGRFLQEVVRKAKACGAHGIIGHTVTFCDPYLHRIPDIRNSLKNEGLPFLFLEGDCTMRSIGQHRTRIEAFIEMIR